MSLMSHTADSPMRQVHMPTYAHSAAGLRRKYDKITAALSSSPVSTTIIGSIVNWALSIARGDAAVCGVAIGKGSKNSAQCRRVRCACAYFYESFAQLLSYLNGCVRYAAGTSDAVRERLFVCLLPGSSGFGVHIAARLGLDYEPYAAKYQRDG